MCLIGWRTAPASPWPLLLAANRDEFHGREALPVHRWTSGPQHLIAGKDLVGGGTWLGLTALRGVPGGPDGPDGPDGPGGRGGLRIAMLTNVRDGRAAAVAPDAPSRGLLVTSVLADPAPASEALARLADSSSLARMAGFNLVAIDLLPSASPPWSIETSYLAHPGPDGAGAAGPQADRLATGGARPRRIDDGIHGLSNGALDAPWPKTRALMAAIDRAGGLRDAGATPVALASADALLLACLTDRRPAPAGELPDTGIDRAREQWLSSPFIPGQAYGTRCSTLIAVAADGRFEVFERRYDRDGKAIGDARETG